MNTRTSKKRNRYTGNGIYCKGQRTAESYYKKLRNVEGVLDIERTAG